MSRTVACGRHVRQQRGARSLARGDEGLSRRRRSAATCGRRRRVAVDRVERVEIVAARRPALLAPTPRGSHDDDVERVADLGGEDDSRPRGGSRRPTRPGRPGFVNSTPIRSPCARRRPRRARASSRGSASVERHRRAAHSTSPQPTTRAPGRTRRSRPCRCSWRPLHERAQPLDSPRTPAAARREQHAATQPRRRRPVTARREHRATHRASHPRLAARVPPQRARRPRVPRRDAVRSRQLARRRRRGTPAARRRCSPIPRTRATSPTGAAPATSRIVRARSPRRTGRRGVVPRCFAAAAPGYGYVADDVPELAIGVYPEFRGQRVGSLLLGALIARASAEGEPRDQPERRAARTRPAACTRGTASRSSPSTATDSGRIRASAAARQRWCSHRGLDLTRHAGAPARELRWPRRAHDRDESAPGEPAVRAAALQRRGARRPEAASGAARAVGVPHPHAVRGDPLHRHHLGWTLVGSQSPEKLDRTRGRASPRVRDRAGDVEGAPRPRCPTAERRSCAGCGAENVRAARRWSTQFARVHPTAPTPAAAVQRLERRLDRHDRRARALRATTSQAATATATCASSIPAAQRDQAGHRASMDDFVREKHPRSTRASPGRCSSRSSKDRATTRR